jgi:predicted DCC family thiol-disulfide oxidoreductase YuxK
LLCVYLTHVAIIQSKFQFQYPVLLFDGICNLCNRSVQFILANEEKTVIRFASLQSGFLDKNLPELSAGNDSFGSVVFINNGIVYTKSDAVIAVAGYLRAPYRYLKFLKWIPRPVRDGVYSLVARTRYRIFGKRKECMIPDPEIASRFLD